MPWRNLIEMTSPNSEKRVMISSSLISEGMFLTNRFDSYVLRMLLWIVAELEF